MKRTEQELVILCSRVSLDQAQVERVQAILSGPIDWDYTIQYSISHGVHRLLYNNLKSVCAPKIPQVVLDKLRIEFRIGTARNIYLSRELTNILQLFERNDILAVPFKGPVLTKSAYGHIGLRSFGDLDIFIRQKDLDRVTALLHDSGYQIETHSDPADKDEFYKRNYHLVFWRERDECYIEIHWDIMCPYFLYSPDLGSILENHEKTLLFDAPVLTLSHENYILLLCIHGMKHNWQRLIWICDVAEIIRSCPTIDWNWLIEQADRIGSKRMLWLGLILAHTMLDAPVPNWIIDQAREDRVVMACIKLVNKGIYIKTSYTIRVFNLFGMYLLRILLKDKTVGRIRHICSAYLSPGSEERKLVPLPSWLSPLYYIMRLVNIVSKPLRWLYAKACG